MGGNVSEWIEADYKDWEPVYNNYIRYLKNSTDSSNQNLIQQLEFFNSKNNKFGKLVRGSNFLDSRLSTTFGKNSQNMNSKIFVSPETRSSTIGFRYVVHFEAK
jgi:formylglycine-generating enzyme required for sulfatase activity